MTTKMFKKILIANRGEIACRVMKTAKKMGIKTVAVYSEADKEARHVQMADEAVCIGPAPSRESYLVMDRIIQACKDTGAQAVHPGYGFLSENEQFAKRCEEEGIVFIGPKHQSIAAMGDKIASKKLALEAKVNTIPGFNEAIDKAEDAVKIAQGIGYPVMIKASAGGGGKGLRVAFNDKEAFEGFTACRTEALNSFGDDRVFIEKFVEGPRHIEIQVLGDSHGNVVYLGERDCSIQRRHQKVIEEAPSPFIDPATRKAMGEQAVALAKAVNYQSAGTVEFVVGKDKSFYFLEMNTRLQVEHPVTEGITGLDLVEQMIRVAAGEKLAFKQEDIQLDGWSMECRINADDPFRNFLPSTGRLVKYRPPQEMDGVRVDTGVYEGGEIPMFYDSMIAKLIVHGKDRTEAIEKMRSALNDFVIRGIHSNIPFQAALLQHPRFVSGDFTTGFIAEEYPHGFKTDSVQPADPKRLAALAAFMRYRYLEHIKMIDGQLVGHEMIIAKKFVVVTGARVGSKEDPYEIPIRLELKENVYSVYIEEADGVSRYDIVSNWRPGEICLHATINGTSKITAQVERRGTKYLLVLDGAQFECMVLSPLGAELQRRMPVKVPPDTSKLVMSPMPGLLTTIAVKVGDAVTAGQKIAAIEAMKMENTLTAAQDGVVAEICAKEGDSLAVDQLIIRFE
ncbi:propionyl-CoA carboxylase alpha chain [Polynucleobacter sphagniphilus]|jgi:propionyl-CoA carboxylase alpha chain|uniref:Biotin carboxylase n=2 Tax=Polynucleobacter sphagniphilus TaxID=1743169 RepID=A0AA43S4S4_9BURK|nr:propionyl-CoA carboxylase alpha chain [Polynucleobacter sphagniphilus]MDH6155516.1 propionyl-CoA carboxylase alpha chain [Polynucleobacter sphagniphilus]MDH6420291.1 propionyl-CoA carboxylase alpha chain [Polynucleobacter sphagniphilus]MDH6503650.1 propionyl-CoA carboxylase alpha chain [Polynucleobacter sphagniphilus]MDH6512797.1 propionyl-CoA carboxylase alpha chain [Polynucleobacter sphagniphilus]